MAPGSEMVYTIIFDPELNMYVTGRQSKRFTRADNQFKNRAMAEDECERRNMNGYTRPTPLQLIPDKTKN